MEKEKMKIGVIGVGHMGTHHARIYSQLEECSLIGVNDSNPNSARYVGESLGCPAFENCYDLLKECDAVSIAVPSWAQFTVARAAIRAGCHVLLEKPGCESYEEGILLRKEAEERSLVLQIGFIERFNYALWNARCGEPGQLNHYISFRSRPFVPRVAKVDVVLDLMIHDLEILSSSEPSICLNISAVGVKAISEELDYVSARLQFQSGLEAELIATRLLDSAGQRTVLKKANSSCLLDLNGFRTIRIDHKTGAKVVRVDRCNKLGQEIKSFLGNVKSPMLNFPEDFRPLRLAEEIKKLAEESC